MVYNNDSATYANSVSAGQVANEGTQHAAGELAPSGPESIQTVLQADANNTQHPIVQLTPVEDKDDTQYSATESGKSYAEIATAKQDAVACVSGPVYEDQPAVLYRRPWKATFFRWGPLGGLFCMLLSVLSILVSLGILMGSKGAPVDNWTVQPSAYLAICTAVANQALRFAAFQGVVIAWWVRASHGATLAQLHYDWRAGTTILGAIGTGRNMGFIGLACLMSTIVAVDGPLLYVFCVIRCTPGRRANIIETNQAESYPCCFRSDRSSCSSERHPRS